MIFISYYIRKNQILIKKAKVLKKQIECIHQKLKDKRKIKKAKQRISNSIYKF